MRAPPGRCGPTSSAFRSATRIPELTGKADRGEEAFARGACADYSWSGTRHDPVLARTKSGDSRRSRTTTKSLVDFEGQRCPPRQRQRSSHGTGRAASTIAEASPENAKHAEKRFILCDLRALGGFLCVGLPATLTEPALYSTPGAEAARYRHYCRTKRRISVRHWPRCPGPTDYVRASSIPSTDDTVAHRAEMHGSRRRHDGSRHIRAEGELRHCSSLAGSATADPVAGRRRARDAVAESIGRCAPGAHGVRIPRVTWHLGRWATITIATGIPGIEHRLYDRRQALDRAICTLRSAHRWWIDGAAGRRAPALRAYRDIADHLETIDRY